MVPKILSASPANCICSRLYNGSKAKHGNAIDMPSASLFGYKSWLTWGVFNVLTTGHGHTAAISETMCKHPLVRKITFTRSTKSER